VPARGHQQRCAPWQAGNVKRGNNVRVDRVQRYGEGVAVARREVRAVQTDPEPENPMAGSRWRHVIRSLLWIPKWGGSRGSKGRWGRGSVGVRQEHSRGMVLEMWETAIWAFRAAGQNQPYRPRQFFRSAAPVQVW